MNTTPLISTAEKRLNAAMSVFLVLAMGAMVLVLGTVLYLAYVDSKRIEQNEEIQAFIKAQAIKNGQNGELIKSCTTPGEPCFERSQAQTAKAVADINRVSIYAAACADRPEVQTVEQIQQCVIERLAKAARVR